MWLQTKNSPIGNSSGSICLDITQGVTESVPTSLFTQLRKRALEVGVGLGGLFTLTLTQVSPLRRRSFFFRNFPPQRMGGGRDESSNEIREQSGKSNLLLQSLPN